MRGTAQMTQARPSSRRVTVVLFVLLALLVPLYVLAPVPDLVRQAVYDAVGVASVLLGFAGVRRYRPRGRRGWLLVFAGFAGWVCGDVIWTAEQYLIPDTYPAPSDALYLASYLLLGAGALYFVRTRNRRDVAAVLDASIIATGVGVLAGVFLITPLAGDSELSLPAKLVSSAYPLADIVLVGVLVRLFAAPGSRTPSYRLLTASVLVTLVADTTYNLVALSSNDPISSRWTDGAWLSAYLLAAAAANVPSMGRLGERGLATESVPSRGRLLALSGGLMLPGVALLVDGALGDGTNWALIGGGTLILSALVLVRMTRLLRVVHVQSVRLTVLAHSDYLTGVPNRRTWDDELARACVESRERATSLCVAMLDLDRFKAYNDTHGHQGGDRLLQEAVTAWQAALPGGALLARYGGEEFAVLVRGRTAEQVGRDLDRLRAVTPGGQTFSAGVALWDPATDPGTAVAGADEALYTAKRAGRDRVVIRDPHAARRPRVAERRLGADRRVPVAEQLLLPPFAMVTQPIVHLATSTVRSHEALARFSGAEAAQGVEQVFRQAHLDGYGDLLELAAIRRALELPGRPAGHELYVNVSARALTSARLLDGLPDTLRSVVVELSEDSADVEEADVLAAVARLRARGARIALDDVGAGSDEFARLARLRPDVVKVDRSLVAACTHDAAHTAVLRALVTYARDLGVEICAEGVEQTDQLLHLRRVGVTHAQGYLLARPGDGWPCGDAAVAAATAS